MKESWESMIDRCAWSLMHDIVSGKSLRAAVITVFNIILAWQKEDK